MRIKIDMTKEEMDLDVGDRIEQLIAQKVAHRACIAQEHDPAKGKVHGTCVVCAEPWPCKYAGTP